MSDDSGLIGVMVDFLEGEFRGRGVVVERVDCVLRVGGFEVVVDCFGDVCEVAVFVMGRELVCFAMRRCACLILGCL